MNNEQANIVSSSSVPQSPLSSSNGLPQPGVPVPVMPSVPNNATPSLTSPQVAEDVDLIEKEWVLKAKDIVSRTKNDPRQQSDSITRFKSDYLMKRYNKDLKSEESK